MRAPREVPGRRRFYHPFAPAKNSAARKHIGDRGTTSRTIGRKRKAKDQKTSFFRLPPGREHVPPLAFASSGRTDVGPAPAIPAEAPPQSQLLPESPRFMFSRGPLVVFIL